MITLESINWGTGPVIPIKFEYEKRRSGANMEYRAQITVSSITGMSYFGYPIYCTISAEDTRWGDITVKSAEPDQWNSPIVYTTAWHTVYNKTSGTTEIKFRVYSGSGSSRDNTYTYQMAIDPAASTFSIDNGTLGVEQIITVTKNDSTFTHTITYVCGSASGTVCTKSQNTRVSFTPPSSLAQQNTTGTNVQVTFSMTTYTSGGTTVGSSTSQTVYIAIPSSYVPTISSITVSDPNEYSDTYGGYVQSLSTIHVVVNASGNNGSTIISYSTTVEGLTYTQQTFTTGTVKGTGTLTITTTVKDSRGRTASESATITAIAYAGPSITSWNVARSNASGGDDPKGGYLKVTFSSKVSTLSNKNSANYSVRYKASGSSSWSNTIALTNYLNNYVVSNGTYVFSASTGSPYDVELIVSDKFSGNVAYTKQGPAALVFMDWKSQGRGLAFGEKASDIDTVSIASNWKMNIRGRDGLIVDGRVAHNDWCMVGKNDGTSASQGWYRVMSGTLTGYNNQAFLVAFHAGFGDYFAGILALRLRCNNNTSVNVEQKTILTRTPQVKATDFAFTTSGNSWVFWHRKYQNYGRTRFDIISKGGTITEEIYNSSNPTSNYTMHDIGTPETLPADPIYFSEDAVVGNALTLNGMGTNVGANINYIPKVQSDSVLEIGSIIDFHNNQNYNVDYHTRLQSISDSHFQIIGQSGTLADFNKNQLNLYDYNYGEIWIGYQGGANYYKFGKGTDNGVALANIRAANLKFDLLYTGSTSSAINFDKSKYNFVIVLGVPYNNIEANDGRASVVCPCSGADLYYMFSDESSYYKFQLTSSGISARVSGNGAISRVYGACMYQ